MILNWKANLCPEPSVTFMAKLHQAQRISWYRRLTDHQVFPWLESLAVIVLAVVLRVLYILQARQNDPLFFSPQLDALYHHQWALAILRRTEFINDAYFRAPLYPFFLALIYRLFGVNLFLARLVQALLGGIGCGLTCLLGKYLFNRRIGFIAGLIMAVYPLFIYFDGELLIPVLLVPLILAGFLSLYYSKKTDRHWWLSGLIFGLGSIARPNLLAFVVVLPLWFILEYRQTFWRRLAVFFLALLVPILPVTIRNYLKSGQLVIIAWQGGTNFFIGNNEHSDGTTAIVPGTRKSWWGGYNDVKLGAEKVVGRELKGAEIDRFWMKKGLEFWQRQPGRALLLTLKKIYLWFAGYEVSNDRDLYFFKRYTFLNFLLFQTLTLKFPFGLILPFGLSGIYLTRRRWRTLLPVYLFLLVYSLSFIIFFVTARYRMPLIPFYLFFAAAGVSDWLKAEKKEKRRSLAIFLVTFFVFNLNIGGAGKPPDPAQNYFTAGLGYYEQRRLSEAERELNQALRIDSATNILSLRTALLLDQGRTEEARRLVNAALRLHPDEAEAYGIAGNFFALQGELESAAVYFQKVVELDPYSSEGWHNLGNIALLKRNLNDARSFYQRALSLSPGWTTALFHLGLMYYYEGKTDSAHLLWRQVLYLNPNYEKARRALEQLR